MGLQQGDLSRIDELRRKAKKLRDLKIRAGCPVGDEMVGSCVAECIHNIEKQLKDMEALALMVEIGRAATVYGTDALSIPEVMAKRNRLVELEDKR